MKELIGICWLIIGFASVHVLADDNDELEFEDIQFYIFSTLLGMLSFFIILGFLTLDINIEKKIKSLKKDEN